MALLSARSTLYSLHKLPHTWILQGLEGFIMLSNLLGWFPIIIWLWYHIY